MRLRVCLSLVLLGLGACETLPSIVRVEVDGSTVEFKKKPAEAPAPQPPAPAAEPGPDAGPR